MPYTLAHPALIVPLRRWIVIGAAAAGAMAPDFGYYLPLAVQKRVPYPSAAFTHSWLGAVTFDVFIGLVAYLMWRWPVRRQLLGALPKPWSTQTLARTAVVLPGRSPTMRAVLLVVSVAVGAISHVLIDLITHERAGSPGFAVDEDVLGIAFPAFLQRSFSVLGLALLAWWIARELHDIAPLSGLYPTRRMTLYIGSAIVAALLGAGLFVRDYPPVSEGNAVIAALLGVTMGGALAILAVSLALASRHHRRVAQAMSQGVRSEPQSRG